MASSLSLTTEDLARLETAARTLLSPLAAPDVDTWRRETMKAVAGVLQADTATFLLPHHPDPIAVYSIDEAVRRQIVNFTHPPFTETGSSPEPLLDEFYRRLVAKRLEVWDMHSGDHLLGGNGVAFNNLFYNEVLQPYGMNDTHALFVHRPQGGFLLTVHNLRRYAGPGENLPVLSLLLPAYKAALDALDRLSAHRAALDAVSEPLATFDVDGREIHRNAALTRLLTTEPEAGRLTAALAELARRVRPLCFPLRGERGNVPAVSAEVRTEAGRYVLRSTVLGPGLYGPDGAFLITVTREAGRLLPAAEEIRKRHGLTRRESEIALLVAGGLSNEEIADRLFVSRHTVRHHVEAVMAKLDVQGRGRAAVAARLLQA